MDASVAVKWVVEEAGSAAAAALLEQPLRWTAPRLMLAEVAGAIRRKIVAREVRTATGAGALRTLLAAVRQGTVELAEDEHLIADALLLSVTLSYRVPDCLYLALAEREGAALSTADVRLARLARARGVPVLEVRA
ncbi:MAG TPA: type II toxin-antitoxin system VapC family toxin [Candidatus Binatia bacterium]|nr:type II toxin-antitoxin system VapC family toxin [Candidatus Binatia bacterium]